MQTGYFSRILRVSGDVRPSDTTRGVVLECGHLVWTHADNLYLGRVVYCTVCDNT